MSYGPVSEADYAKTQQRALAAEKERDRLREALGSAIDVLETMGVKARADENASGLRYQILGLTDRLRGALKDKP